MRKKGRNRSFTRKGVCLFAFMFVKLLVWRQKYSKIFEIPYFGKVKVGGMVIYS